MARKTINQLTELTEVNGGDKLAIYEVSTNTTKKISVDNLFSSGFDIYSTSEVKTNKVWINGKPIYRKVVDCGALPNNGLLIKNPDISSYLDTITTITGVAIRQPSVSVISLPYMLAGNDAVSIELWYAGNNIRIQSTFDASIYTLSYVTLEYTKTTD